MESNNKKRYNVILDDETIKMLINYSKNKLGSINISQSIRLIVREYLGDKNERNKK